MKITRMIRNGRIALLAWLFFGAAACAQAAAPPAAADDEAPYLQLLLAGKARLDGKDPVAALADIDQVIAYFEKKYAGSTKVIYGARGTTETLLYLAIASNGKTEAIVLDSLWGDAYYLKGYALVELGRVEEARSSIELALRLSPNSPLYLSELGELASRQKNWDQALALYLRAEQGALLTAPEEKDFALARAWRGQAFVYVELHKLSEAAELYRKCLALNPDDQMATRELAYVRSLQSAPPSGR